MSKLQEAAKVVVDKKFGGQEPTISEWEALRDAVRSDGNARAKTKKQDPHQKRVYGALPPRPRTRQEGMQASLAAQQVGQPVGNSDE